MRDRPSLKHLITGLVATALLACTSLIWAAPPSVASSAGNTSVATADSSTESNAEKARELVQAAINMTDSDKAVKLLWQATDLDPTYDDAYVYLGFYYNSKSDFSKVVEVYKKMVKYQPNEVTAYLNIGEAYMSFSPPRYNSALPYYQKAIQLQPASSFAALRLGEIYAQQGNRDAAIKYLKLASMDHAKPAVAAEANRVLRQMGAS